MRGDRPLQDTMYHIGGEVYPACAGIDLSTNTTSKLIPRLPRMRGDRPLVTLSSPSYR